MKRLYKRFLWWRRSEAVLNRNEAFKLCEPLERRQMLSTVTWTNPAGGAWGVGGNWSNGIGPGSTDDVVINEPGNVVITHTSGSNSVSSIVTSNPITLTGGSIAVATTLDLEANLTLNGGSLTGASVTTSDGSKIVAGTSGGVLGSVAIGSGVVLDMTTASNANLAVTGGMTLNGTINIGDPASGFYGRLYFYLTQTLTGTGTINFGVSSNNGLYAQGNNGSTAATLTIASGITIQGKTGGITGYFGIDSVINNGVIDASGGGVLTLAGANPGTFSNSGLIEATGGGTLTLAGPWSSSGTISETNSVLNLGGNFTLASINLPTFSRTGGTVNLTGTLTNTGTLALNTTTGPWNLLGGTIAGGTVTDTAGALLIGTTSGGVLAGVTIPSGTILDMTTASNANLAVTGGMTLNGTINIGDPASGFYGRLYFYLTQTLTGTGTINFGVSSNNGLYAQGNNGSTAATLTIASGITIQGKTGGITGYFGIDSVINNGVIDASGGGVLTLAGANPGTFSNSGLIEATGGGTLTLAGPWSSSGTISETNSVLNLGGNFTLASINLPTFSRTGGTVNLTGTLTNTGTLALNTTTGPWNLLGGTIAGGTVTDTAGALLIGTTSGGVLAGVTIPSGTILDMTTASNANLAVTGGMTLNGTINIGDPASGFYGRLYFYLTQTLTGTGTINFGVSSNNGLYAQGNNGSTAATLTIASGITIQGKTGGITGYFGIDSVINNGVIDASGGGVLTLAGANPGTFSNSGLIEATGGGTLTLAGPWSSSGTISETNSVLNLGGNFTLASINLPTFSRTGGTVNLTGTLTNTGTLALNTTTGPWNLLGGTIAGGTITDSGANLLLITPGGGTLSGVTIPAGSVLDATHASNDNVTIVNGMTLNGNMNLGDAAGSFYGRAYFFLTQSLTGTGTVTMGASPSNDLYAQGNNGATAATLTVGSGILIQVKNGGLTGYFTIDSIVNNGTIAEIGGGALAISGGIPGTFTNSGSVTEVAGGTLSIQGPWSNQAGGTISATTGLLNLGSGNSTWSNAGVISMTNAVVNLGGAFTQTGLGTFTRTGGTVNLTGTLNNIGTTFALKATTGSWNLSAGTIVGGTITDVTGSLLVLTGQGGTLNGVTVPAGTVLDGTTVSNGNVTMLNGMTLNGNINLGDAAGSFYGRAYFFLTQTLSGTGAINFGASAGNNIYAEGNNGATAAALTIGSGITIQGKSGGISGYFTIDSVVNDGTISETGAGLITISGGIPGPFANAGAIRVSSGGTLTIGGPWTNQSSGTISATSALLNLGSAGSAWSNAGLITATNSTTNLGGVFSVAGLGAFSRTGGAVNLTGTLTNTAATLALNATTGSWNLVGGTIVGGTITDVTGSLLVLTGQGGFLNGVTLPAGTVLDGTTVSNGNVTILNGMTLNGNINLGDAAGSFYGRAYFFLTQTLTGTGAINFGGSAGNNVYAQGNNSQTAGTLTVGSGITIQGKYGALSNYFTIDSVINNGSIVETGGGTITLASAGAFVNNGAITAVGTGGIVVNSALTDNDPAFVSISPNGTFQVSGNLLGSSKNMSLFQPAGRLTLNGAGTSASPQLFEAMSQDLGAGAAGFANNFAFGSILLSGTDYVKLVDQFHNNSTANADAVYVNSLNVPAGTTLNLSGLHLYVRDAQIGGTVIGSITQIPDAGAITVNSPTPGSISAAGELDSWTFFDKAGQSVSVLLDPGSGGAGGPLNPSLQFAQIQLIDPNNNVVASASSTTGGAIISLNNIVLATDGTYTITVKAAASHTAGTGNYVLSAYNVTPHIQSLNLNQNVAGTLGSPFALDQWTFAAAAGTQVQFKLAAASAPGIVYSLTGPGGFLGFTNATASSSLINLTASGTYTLAAQGSGGASGSYGFQITQTNVSPLALSTTANGSFVASGQAQLYSITVPTANPMTVNLSDANSSDHTEIYARFGAPPTRELYDVGVNSAGASHSLLIPNANAGTWYVLVYAESIASPPSSYTLRADSAPLVVSSVTPDHYGANSTAALTVTGAGFAPGSTVALVAANSTVYPAGTVSFDTFTQLSADIDLTAVPQGVYSVRVTRPDATSDDLPSAFTVASAGQAVLSTKLTLPGSIGRHIASTFYVTYSNSGNVAMPAPLLLLESSVPTDVPIMTLDASRVVAGFWTSALPEGYSNTITILASGKVPGILGPGESVTVPVYYAGMEQPWDFSHTQFKFDIRYFTATDNTPINWPGLQSSLRPANIPAAPWATIFSNLESQLGTTAGSYTQLLDNEAAYLGQLGENVTNVSQLWSFAVQQAANDTGPLSPYLNTATDASVATPGTLALAFDRDFSQSIVGRDISGILGAGWSTPWETHLSVATDGTATVISAGGAERVFQPDSRTAGVYFSENGDPGVLTFNSSTYLITEANGSQTDFLANGELNYVQDTNGNRITAAYSGSHLTTLTASSGQSLAIAYNGAGHVSSVTDSLGRASTYTYDSTNTYLTAVTWFNGQTTTYTYNTAPGAAQNSLASIAFPGGTHEFFTYDSEGRVSGTSADGGAQALTFGYTLGLVTTTDSADDITKLYYNQNGQVVKSVDALGNATLRNYDVNGYLTSVTDPLGITESYAYNKVGEMTSLTDYDGNITQYNYSGALNRLASSTDANGNVTSYTYNSAGDLLTTTYANGLTSSFTYDPQGDALSFVNPGGQAIHYTFNAFGLVTGETFADNSSYTFTYDSHNNLLTATDATGVTIFTYDPTTEQLTHVAYPGGLALTFAYDSAGRRVRMVDQTGFTVNYAYDALGRLSQLTDASSSNISTYTYDAAGRLSQATKGNGTYTTYTYDAAGELLHLVNFSPTNAVNSRYDYTYNALGLETGETTLDGSWVYTYDADGQLTHAVFTSTNVSIPSQDLAYTYDAAGNRKTTVVNGLTTNYSNNDMNQYTAVGGATYTYDASGNLLSDGTNTYTYNQLGQLTSITAGGTTTTYTWNSLAQQVASTTSGVTTQYLNDPADVAGVFGTFTGGGATIAHYPYGFGVTSQVTGGGTSYYDFDAIGNAVGMTNAGGTNANTYAYTPFGTPLLSTGTLPNPFQFAGQFGVTTVAPGLTEMTARVYTAATGRFSSPDPLQLGGGNANFYTYVFNRPTTLVDPDGLSGGGLQASQLVALSGSLASGAANTPGKLGKGVWTTQLSIWKLLLQKLLGKTPKQVWQGGYISVGVSGSSGGSTPTKPGNNNDGPDNSDQDSNDDDDDDDDDDNPDDPGPDDPGPSDPGPDNPNPGGPGDPGDPPPGPGGPDDPGDPPGPSGPGGPGGGGGGAGAGNSMDPNSMIGPAGAGPGNAYIATDGTQPVLFPYQIDFENAASATAPAQHVGITDQLGANLDWSTFQLTGIGFGDTTILIPADSQYFQTTVSMTYNGKTFDVQIEAGIHTDTGVVFANISSIDPDTELPPDVLTGFLPPEDGTGRGKGYIGFLVSPKANLATGTQIRNVAVITFDSNTPIATDQVSETDASQGTDPAKEALVIADNGAPTSSVVALPAISATPSFTVNWSGNDDVGGSGIATYDVYVSVDGGPYSVFLGDTSATSSTYNGASGHTYAFYSVATDFVGHVQATPGSAQALTSVNVVGAASKLAFIQTPPTAYAGKAAGSIMVAVEDANSVIVTTDSSSITLHLATSPAGAALTGTVTVAVHNGIATFTNAILSKIGGYTLDATDAALAGATSSSLTVVAAPTHLVITQQPTTVVAGQTLSHFIVAVEDATGHIVASDTSAITLAMPAGATISGTVMVNAIAGQATFSGLIIDKAGKFVLVANDGVLTVAKSKTLAVTPDVSTAHLFLATQTASSLIGKPLTYVVDVVDQFGNIVTTDRSKVALSIFGGPLGAVLAGTTTVAAVNGVATFKNLLPSISGSYTLHANDTSLALTTAVSIAQTITPGTSSVTAPHTVASYTFGTPIVLSTTLKSNAAATVHFTGNATIVDNNSNTLGTATVAANGAVKFSLINVVPGTYTCTLDYPGDANHTPIDSTPFTLHVVKAPTTTTLKVAPTATVSGQGVLLTATVNATGGAAGTVRTGSVTFFDGLTQLGSAVPLGSNNTATFTIPFPAVGTHSYTAVYSGDGDFLTSASAKAPATVKKDSTQIALLPSIAGPITHGTSFNLTATVTVVAPGLGLATGNVIFKDGTTVLGTIALDGTGNAVLTGVSFGTAGTQKITAIYSGDPLDNSVTSSVLTLTIT